MMITWTSRGNLARGFSFFACITSRISGDAVHSIFGVFVSVACAIIVMSKKNVLSCKWESK